MNQRIAQWRVLEGEHAKRLQRDRAEQCRQRRRERIESLCWSLVCVLAAFALWVA
jgi:hypothetical protein